jgi:peptidoglycan/LPS O-acetylase OafA/YrhL
MIFEPGMQADRGRALQSLQILRGVAALAVLAMHVPLFVEGKLGLTGFLPPMFSGAAGVDLFFVISGFIMVYSSLPLFGRADAPLQFFVRRLARIVPLYWLASGILLAYLIAASVNLASIEMNWTGVAASFLFIPYPRMNGQMLPLLNVGWTLNYEMFFYAVFAVALLTPRRVAVPAVTVLFAALVAVGLMGPWPAWFSFLTSPVILEFCFGMLIALAFVAPMPMPRVAAFGLIFVALAGFVVSVQFGDFGFWRTFWWGLPSAALVAGMLWLGRDTRFGPVGRVLALIGDASYSLYLFHWIVLLAVPRVITRFIDPASAPWLCVAVMALAPILVAIAVHFWFERPATRFLQGRVRVRARVREAPLRGLTPAVTTSRSAPIKAN